MFNTYTSKTEAPVLHVSKETIIHKSITPDKVTDMYDKIAEEVQRVYRVESNQLNGIVFEVNHPTRTLFTRFILNGKEYIDKCPLDEGIALTPDVMLKNLRDRYAEAVAMTVVVEAATFTRIK